jgi:hypothetical protein
LIDPLTNNSIHPYTAYSIVHWAIPFIHTAF